MPPTDGAGGPEAPGKDAGHRREIPPSRKSDLSNPHKIPMIKAYGKTDAVPRISVHRALYLSAERVRRNDTPA